MKPKALFVRYIYGKGSKTPMYIEQIINEYGPSVYSFALSRLKNEDDLTRFINYIENTRIEKLSVRPVATGGTNDAIAFFTDGGEPVTFDYTRSALMSNSITYTLPTDCLAKVYDHNRDFSGDVYLDIDGKKVTLSKEDAETVRAIVSGGSWWFDRPKTHYTTKLVIGDKRLGYELGLRLLPCGRGSVELNFAASQRLLAVLENYIN